MSKTKIVFIAHPISGDVENNLKKVVAICKEIHTEKIIPLFPSFTWRMYLEETPEDRVLAKVVNLALFKKRAFDEIWFYGNRLSDGMKEEAFLAKKYGIKIVAKSKETKKALKDLGLL